MAKEQGRAPYRERFFSSMDYDEYVMYFGPPKPLLKPSADPQFLDNFELNPQTKFQPEPAQQERVFHQLPTIRESKMQEESSNNNSQRFVSPLMQYDQEPKVYKRPRNRMRSQSENNAHLIFNFLDRQEGIQKKKVKLDR